MIYYRMLKCSVAVHSRYFQYMDVMHLYPNFKFQIFVLMIIFPIFVSIFAVLLHPIIGIILYWFLLFLSFWENSVIWDGEFKISGGSRGPPTLLPSLWVKIINVRRAKYFLSQTIFLTPPYKQVWICLWRWQMSFVIVTIMNVLS